MRFKVVPPARGLETLRAAHRAVPLVPGSVEDCCARVMARAGVPARDEAREWLTFLRALELAEETETGYRRSRAEPEPEPLAAAFRDRVYGAAEVLAVLSAAEDRVSVDQVAERVPVPDWERRRHQDPEAVWRERIERLLGWAVALDLAERSGEGYRA